MGDEQDPAGTLLHHPKGESGQAKRREERRQRSGRHDHSTHDRHRQKVRDQPVVGEPVEMRRGIGRGGKAADQGTQHQSKDRHHPARHSLQIDAAVDKGKPGDQRNGRGKGHLETGVQQAFGQDQKEDQGGHRGRTQGKRAAVQKDGPQKDRNHDEGALGRDIRPGKNEVEESHPQADHCGDLLGVHPQRHIGDQRQAIAQEAEDKGRQEGHVHPGNRQKMGKRTVAERLHGLFGDGGTVAGHRPCRKGAGLALHMGQHAFGQIAPKPIDGQGTLGVLFQKQHR